MLNEKLKRYSQTFSTKPFSKKDDQLTDTFPFLDYAKASDEVRRPQLFSILHDRNNRNPLLTAIIKIYEKIK